MERERDRERERERERESKDRVQLKQTVAKCSKRTTLTGAAISISIVSPFSPFVP